MRPPRQRAPESGSRRRRSRGRAPAAASLCSSAALPAARRPSRRPWRGPGGPRRRRAGRSVACGERRGEFFFFDDDDGTRSEKKKAASRRRNIVFFSLLFLFTHLPALLEDLVGAVADHAASFRLCKGLLRLAGGFDRRLCLGGGRHFFNFDVNRATKVRASCEGTRLRRSLFHVSAFAAALSFSFSRQPLRKKRGFFTPSLHSITTKQASRGKKEKMRGRKEKNSSRGLDTAPASAARRAAAAASSVSAPASTFQRPSRAPRHGPGHLEHAEDSQDGHGDGADSCC